MQFNWMIHQQDERQLVGLMTLIDSYVKPNLYQLILEFNNLWILSWFLTLTLNFRQLEESIRISIYYR